MLVAVPASAALNVDVFDPAAIASDAGIVTAVLVEDRFTVIPPEGAACPSVTVQVALAPDTRLVGLHAREEIGVVDVTRLIVALAEPPLYVPLTMAL
jgi:hypothetical protein